MFVTVSKAEEKMAQNGDAIGALNSMLSRFNRQVNNSGLMKELKLREYYEKPSDKRRRRHAEALARMKKERAKNV